MRRHYSALDLVMVRQRIERGAYIPARFGPLAHAVRIELNAEARARGAK
jgi:hypothetical protein